MPNSTAFRPSPSACQMPRRPSLDSRKHNRLPVRRPLRGVGVSDQLCWIRLASAQRPYGRTIVHRRQQRVQQPVARPGHVNANKRRRRDHVGRFARRALQYRNGDLVVPSRDGHGLAVSADAEAGVVGQIVRQTRPVALRDTTATTIGRPRRFVLPRSRSGGRRRATRCRRRRLRPGVESIARRRSPRPRKPPVVSRRRQPARIQSTPWSFHPATRRDACPPLALGVPRLPNDRNCAGSLRVATVRSFVPSASATRSADEPSTPARTNAKRSAIGRPPDRAVDVVESLLALPPRNGTRQSVGASAFPRTKSTKLPSGVTVAAWIVRPGSAATISTSRSVPSWRIRRLRPARRAGHRPRTCRRGTAPAAMRCRLR